ACQSRAQAPEAGCTYGSSSSGESYYFCSSQSRTWHTAGLSCQNAGMQLLNVDTPGENSYAASQLNVPAWIGVKRASSDDWLDLEDNVDFENTNNELVWHTDTPSQQVCPWFGPCTTTDTEGHFINDVPGDPAASDLVDSTPWTTASTWVSPLEPTPTDIVWGNNCVTLDPQAKWSTDACSAVPEPSCGFLGLDCLLSALLGALANLVGGVLSWLTAGLINLTDLVHLGTGGLYNAPHFSGGVEHPYVCEQQATTRDVTLDPGTYYVVVQGIDDGQTGNSCAGPYDLSIADVGTPTGGFMACDDNGVAETTSSVLQSTLSDGDYYLVLKGKHAADSGAYALTVRDVGAVQTSELACDAGTGVGDPAQLTFSAQPGHQYYALLKGDAPGDTGPYSFAIRDVSRITGQRLACDDTSGPGGSSAFTASLGTGTYYAVLKGTTPGAQGNYRLTVGGASPTTSSFTPPTYAQTTKALTTNGIRVATVLSCEGKPCDDALAQAKELAQDTGGSVLAANTPSDVPAQLVSAVYGLESLDNITGTLLFAPDPNPGFLNVSMLTVPTGSIACTDVGDGVTLASCGPGARPTYAVSLLNPLLAAVPPGPGPLGSYRFTLHLQGQRNGSTIYTEDVPLYVLPSGGAAAGTYGKGSYTQDMDGRGCVHANTAPSWQELVFDADVRPDTRLEFYACSASDSADLTKCDTAGGTSTGYQRVLTVSAGGGLGVPCSVITQLIDCPEGYCSPYTGTCTYLEGASCVTDKDCPNALPGSCRTGPSAATLGTTCSLGGSVVGNPSSALDAGDLNPFLRMRIDFTSGGNQSRTPSLFAWEARYRCLSVL
ncbi:MAG TPA: C-type lectin domain-containing protein, partial [Polyangiales bacterium]|nr:C-type lectin domain-containing protein [Polyangiales bacterium]